MRIVGHFEEEFAGRRNGREAQRGAVVDDPVSTSDEKGLVAGRGANGEHAAAGGFAGACAGGRVFNHDTILRGETDCGGAPEIRLGIGFAPLNVRGRDEMGDVFPEVSNAQTNFGEGTSGGSDDSEPAGWNCSKQLFGAGEGDNVGDIFDFSALHPLIFGKVRGGLSLGQEFSKRSEARTAVSEFDDVFGIHVVFTGPARPHAGDGRGGVNEDAVHVDEQTSAQDLSHVLILAGARRISKRLASAYSSCVALRCQKRRSCQRTRRVSQSKTVKAMKV